MANLKFFEKVGEVCNNAYARTMLSAKRHAPELWIVAGIGLGAGCVVAACKATLKVEHIHEEASEKLDLIEKQEAIQEAEVYSEEDAKKDKTIVYVQTGVKYVKEFAPAAILGVMSVGCVLYSNKLMRQRAMALATAYATLATSYDEYRKRVAEVVGEDAELRLFRGIKAVTLEEPVLNKKGEPTGKVKKTVVDVADGHGSPYSKEFDRHCNGWNNGNPEYIDYFLRAQEFCANDMLKSRGYLFLNEVYHMLGMEPTVAGQSVGWICEDDNGIGDNKVKFDRYIVNKPIERDGQLVYEKTHMIDFNVDGDILNRVSLKEI